MVKKTFPFLLLFVYNFSSSQNIEIGQDANEIKQIIEWSTKSHRKPDSYGNKSNSYWTSDTEYYNGTLIEVSQCYQNQYLHDFRVNADYCKRYIMGNNKLSYVLTQFENISIEKLRENYNSMYSESKINDFYFFNNYNNYSKIYLAKNGLATIEMRKTIVSELPKAVQQTLVSKLAELKDREVLIYTSAYDPTKRKMIIRPNPEYICNEQGIVVVQISVDKLGNVIKAIPGINGTTNNAKCLINQAKIAAMRAKMESNENAPDVEIRKIIYNFNFGN